MNLSTLPDRGFKLTERAGLVLVTPRREKAARSDWTNDDLPLRSVVLRESTGEVVSAGFPKFFNAGETGRGDGTLGPEEQALRAALAAGEPVHFTDKVDGSLCIRSIIDGQVAFRTRGTLDATPHTQAMRTVAERRYPILLDPEFMADASLLFEFVSPVFRIVLAYDEPDLILLGAIEHADLAPWDVPALTMLATNRGLRLVQIVELPTQPDALMDAVAGLKGREGIVARCDRGRTLVKLKSAEYLALHRLRFALSARRVREVCAARDVRSAHDFESYLAEHDADWELLADVRPLVDTYLEAREAAQARLDRLAREVDVHRHLDRREFAVGFAVPLGAPEAPAAFSLLDGKPDRAIRGLLDAECNTRFAELEAADEARLAALDP